MQSSRISPSAGVPDSALGQDPAAPSPSEGGKAAAPDPADLRLVIEEDEASGSYVYKTVDRMTGQVVFQLPREQLLRLRDNPIYEAGDVIRAKA
jgi:flagellar protein FlaG